MKNFTIRGIKGCLLILWLFFPFSNNSLVAQSWDQIIKTVASDRAADDRFGYSVSISGDYAIVGAYQEDQNASGGSTLSSAGSAYIFKNNAGSWVQVQKIVASDRGASDYFGYSVSISGNYAIVGAYGEDQNASGGSTLSSAGSAYIFKNNEGSWEQVQKIVASDRGESDYFGRSVSIAGDYAIVGANQEDEDASGGSTLSMAGSAYIFKNNAGSWEEVEKIVASDRAANDYFGRSVSISGSYAIVGAYGEDEDASSVNTLDYAGSAYIFKNNNGAWTQAQKIVASDRGTYDYFGSSVSISGNYAIVGAYGEDQNASGGSTLDYAGSAYIFKNNGSTWTQEQKIVASDRAWEDYFGHSVSISGSYAIVGAYYEDHNASGGSTLSRAGSAYIFKNNGSAWTQEQKIVASDRAIEDYFGSSVSISGSYAIVGAYQEDENASGGSTLSSAGSAYIYHDTTVQTTLLNGIISYWNFDENFDASVGGASYNCAESPAGVTIDESFKRFGGASAKFERTQSGYLSVPSSPFSQGSHTYAAWYYLDITEITGSNRYFILEATSGSNSPESYGLRVGTTSPLTGEQIGQIYTHDNGWYPSSSPVKDILSGSHQQWHHIAVTFNSSTKSFQIYLDGILLDETMTLRVNATSISASTRMVIGGHRDYTGRNWQGWIDEVAVWNRVLSAEEIAWLQSNPISSDPELLPVELTSFTGVVSGSQVNLYWETATEVNNYGFEIERSSAGLNVGMDEWNNIGFVHGHGTSYSPKSYAFIDNNPPAGNLKYRLKQIDLDGSYEYYGTIAEVTFGVTEIGEELLPAEFALYQNYPNPFNPATRIKYSIPAGEEYFGFMRFVSLRIYDILGNEVAVVVNEEKAPGNYEVEFNASNLASGTYIYQLNAGEFRQTKKAVLLK